ncbi:hydroxymethylglutaryl-CoA reductase, degradative [Lapidilactobacillus dextrinicus]|uniref:hydroxymethylglutaryl-CoA reductase, degradative n=1 Tax=Lapidilactobacillus dextrinicus TaxID=51664 RepID=UPI0022E971CB|nr:hydroxymethylglutaryl-CoA reductase, degradative [Lapidilactobacillus dextrinicus]
MKFYELSRQERLAQLQQQGILSATSSEYLLNKPALSDQVLSAMVENNLGQFNLPFGVADNFVIDGQSYLIPMVTEEPSVIAAASNGAKRVAAGGGFTTTVKERLLKAQVIIANVTDFADFTARFNEITDNLKQVANDAHPSIVRRGGGLHHFSINQVGSKFVEVELWIDPVAAFGANLANTIAEAVAQYLQTNMLNDQELITAAILSNSGQKMLAKVTCKVPFEVLATKKMSGQQVAQRIATLNDFAHLNADRGATENKGILNGVFAVALATGNDVRALSAATAAYLNAQNPTVLSTWQADLKTQTLLGQLTLPLTIGSVGGAINSLPGAQISLEILQQPTVEKLMGIMASVGLANNLAALRALVTSGIQAGHMRLQSANLAIQAGATGSEITTLQQQLNQANRADLALAQALLQQLRDKKGEQEND